MEVVMDVMAVMAEAMVMEEDQAKERHALWKDPIVIAIIALVKKELSIAGAMSKEAMVRNYRLRRDLTKPLKSNHEAKIQKDTFLAKLKHKIISPKPPGIT